MNNKATDNSHPNILLIEDSISQAMIYLNYLTKSGHTAEHVDTGGAGLLRIKADPPELVLLDLELPDIPGMSVLKYIADNNLPCAVVILTGHGTIDIAVEAMQAGAFDFLTKPFDAERFNFIVKNALAHQTLNQRLCQQDFDRDQYQGFIGGSEAMQLVYQMIDNVALSKASVFICGESGTGKELCAEALHQKSPRAAFPFVALNCASIPKDLMESEFFGHVKGAFTGAHTDREGAVEQASNGTLFLDEICEMDLELQSKLLRFIQTGVYRKVGSSKEKKVDIRFVCATNKNPLEEVTKGHFREDLYYRLHVIPLNLPPLRDRGFDSVMIANHLLQIYANEENKLISGFTPEAEEILHSYQWPGNVREMQNIIRLIAVLNNVEWITPQQLPAPLNTVKPTISILDNSNANTNANINANTNANINANTSAFGKPLNEQQVMTAAVGASSFIDRRKELAHTLHNRRASDVPSGSQAQLVTSDHDEQELAQANNTATAPEVDFLPKEKIEPFGVYEKKIIEAAISRCDGNVPEAAAQLALSPSTLYRKIQAWRTNK